ncbi:uncharacterized protein LOC143218307 [Lasioglossum baleicum]|uniref:uncharacterized protein LOC143218307 n=1 Tax=Lasioglossum baleicum TaxID=434251 RepID=UPI003FCD38AB
MILKSSSNHHPLNMRLLLIALTCLGAAIAAPQLKQKRDILPGDPRYGTDYHHHHHHHAKTIVESTKSTDGYSYDIPETPLQLPQEIYGPPHYQQEITVNNDYLPPALVTPGPSYGEPIGVNAPLEIAPEEPAIVDVRTVLSSTPLPLPLEHVQPVTLSPLTTSYGTPVVDHVKTAVKTFEAPVKTVKTEIHGHATLDVAKPVLKVKEPLVQGTHVVTGVQSVPTVATTVTKNYVSGSLINKSVPTLHSTVGLVPTFNAVSHTPSVFDHSTALTGAHVDFSGFGTDLTSLHGLKSLNTDTTFTSGLSSAHIGGPLTSFKSIPTVHPVQYQTYGVPHTNFQLPESLTHIEQHVAPAVKTFETVTPAPFLHSVKSVQPQVHPVQTLHTYQAPLKSVETLTHVHQPLHQTLTHVAPVNTVKTLDTLTYARQPLQQTVTHVKPVHTVKTVDTLTHQPLHQTFTHVEPVHSVKTLDTLTHVHQPLHQTLTHVEPVHSVKTLDTLTHQPLHSYQPVHTAHLSLPTIQPHTSVKSVHHVQPVTSIKSVKTLTPVHHLESVHTHPIESVETLHHAVDTVDVLPAVQRTHTYAPTVYQKNVNVHVQKDAFSDFFSNLGANLPTLPSLPQLPSLPSLPSFQFPTLQTSTAKPLEVPTVVNTYVSEDHARDSITVDNPLFRGDNHVFAQHVTPSKEYLQPTDANGGYVY